MAGDDAFTASSVCVMAAMSIFTAMVRALTGGFDIKVVRCWAAMAFVVVLGAPIGSVILSPGAVPYLRKMFYALAVIQFVMFGALKVQGDVNTWLAMAVLFAVEFLAIGAHYVQHGKSAKVLGRGSDAGAKTAETKTMEAAPTSPITIKSKGHATGSPGVQLHANVQSGACADIEANHTTIQVAMSDAGGGAASTPADATASSPPELPSLFFTTSGQISDEDMAAFSSFRSEYRHWRMLGKKGSRGEVGSCVSADSFRAPKQSQPASLAPPADVPTTTICAICQQPPRSPVRLRCSGHHSFCWDCLKGAHQKDLRHCPLCRAAGCLDPWAHELDVGLSRQLAARSAAPRHRG